MASLCMTTTVSWPSISGIAFDEQLREIKLRSFPISGKVLRTLCNCTVLHIFTRAANSNERRQAELLLGRCSDELLEHPDEFVHGFVALHVLIGVAPKNGLRDTGLGKVGFLLESELDHPGPNVGATDIDADDRMVTTEYPGRG